MEHPTRSPQFWLDLLIRPGRAFANFSPNLWLSLGLILGLIAVSVLRLLVTTADPLQMPGSILITAFGILTVWISLCFLFHAVSLFLGAQGKFLGFVSYMALASLPVTLMTLVSLILYRPFPVPWLHTAVGFLGVVWGWPGLFTYYALVHGEKLHPKIARIFVILVLLLISIGWFLPAILSM